ncbi:PPA1309 family protein [Actinoalloteichus hymeniacidonis]|uniref:Uncharacterized protein n=1 Tax=Actinoalloteichus hymeniacidonis TaxID=340345 RepID=A0AAC9MXA0_9PSEU|nr:PPA1309 family protein [Actinoalloteichus hymeniacidonis]AOS61816.1 hypothetical protein TL08_04930 [Actinoalloteichus hymeniacidonis]MBB5910165.1 hypothetical protein [Actinoalloteichus hymeniacidonis]
MVNEPAPDLSATLPAAAREVEDFVSTGGWDQPTQLFALVRTEELLAREPGLADRIDSAASLTPIAQDELPDGDLGDALAGIVWPEGVDGCALAQEIVVLPPEAEEQLPTDDDPELAKRIAAEHPDRREARVVAAVLRDGTAACVLRLRSEDSDGPDEEIIEHPELAPNLVDALRATFRP